MELWIGTHKLKRWDARAISPDRGFMFRPEAE